MAMHSSLRKLLEHSTASLVSAYAGLPAEMSQLAGQRSGELDEMLRARNGLFALEGALHVFPVGDNAAPYDLSSWNLPDAWKVAYQDSAVEGALFFGEDVFGGQFAIVDDAVAVFDPETGEFEQVAQSLGGWAKWFVADRNANSGYPVAHAWQQQHGALPPGYRLVPKRPFVMGGEYVAENVAAMEQVAAMNYYANLAVQIRNVPDGGAIELAIED